MNDAIVLLSGGKDSAIALWWAAEHYRHPAAVSIHYPERPAREITAARTLADRCGTPLIEPELPFIKTVRAARADNDRRFDTGNAYIPMRNLVFFSVAAYFAESRSASAIVGGQLRSDGVAYSDATASFFESLEGTVGSAVERSFATDERQISIELPLIDLSDADAIGLGVRLGVPFELTWSCLEDGVTPCGECVSCQDRQRALNDRSRR